MVKFLLRPNGIVAIQFPFSEELVAIVKSLRNRRWNKDAYEWEIPVSDVREAAQAMNEPFDKLPKSVRDAVEEAETQDTILSIDNTFSRIRGHDLPMESLEEVTSFWVMGAQYSKKYQDGIWDGMKHLIRKRGGISFPTGLFSKVEFILKRAGHDYKIEDHRVRPLECEPITPQGHKLRDYQRDVLKSVARQERGILQLATGAGKTLIAAHLIADKGLRSLFFVHTKDLLYQTIQNFQQILAQPIGIIGDGKVQIERITVATIQTVARAMDVKIVRENTDDVPIWSDEASEKLTLQDYEAISDAVRQCQVTVFDECHHLPADTFYEIAMKLPNSYYRYGLSATPWRSDRSDLMIEAALGPKLCVVNSTELIQRGFLVPPKITMYEVLPTGRKLMRKYAQVYLSEVVEHEQRNQLIADVSLHSASRGKSVLILLNQVKHGKLLEKMIEGSVFIHGKDTSDVRNQALERLRQKTNQVLIATTLADEGLDLPSLDVLILAGAGKSETRALQRVGRALRLYPGKKFATIVDFWDQTLYLEEHSRQRLEIYQTEPAFEVDIRPPRNRGSFPPRQKAINET